ncbi:hypothetical protein BD408DRAFT_83617 [Parasitella parasitica]|nr:hypothetical protein BD408DRAFT_83617 [Parasitella parasitica]
MKELLDYVKYNQVLCFDFHESGWLDIYLSSNKLVLMESVKRVVSNIFSGFSIKESLEKYVEIYSKDAKLRTKKETHLLSSTIERAIKLKQEIIQDDTVQFDKSQFLFCLPPEWTREDYEAALRALYLRAGWMTKDDDKNRLMLSTHTENAVNYLQYTQPNSFRLQRERKYVLAYMSKSILKVTCFQMQTAKELVTVSRKLAASDFLLVPTTLNEKIISLPKLNGIVYTEVKRIIIKRIINGLKSKIYLRKRARSSGLWRNSRYQKLGVQEIVQTIAYNIDKFDYFDEYKPISKYIVWDNKAAKRLLKEWTWSDIITKILKNADIQEFSLLADACRNIHVDYNLTKDSPEGIQSVIMLGWSSSVFQKYIFQHFDNTVSCSIPTTNPNLYIRDELESCLCVGAMQKPYKMIQIANALLPPSIWNGNSVVNIDLPVKDKELDLIPPNSFYLQAYIHEDCIDFILNKAVAVSLVGEVAQKSSFTVQEKAVSIDSLGDSVCNKLWDYLETMDFKECKEKYCSGRLSMENYQCFRANLRNSDIFTGKDSSKWQQISISNNCKCALNIPNRVLLDVGLKPSIGSVGTIIASTLASNSFFGLYNVSALIVISDYEYAGNSIMKEIIQRRLQIHRKKPVVFFGEQELAACMMLGEWAIEKKQILGKGSYSQLSNSNYLVKFHYFPGRQKKMYECDRYSYKMAERNLESVVLKQHDCLGHEGVSTFFFFKDTFITKAELHVEYLSHEVGPPSYHRVWVCPIISKSDRCPFAVRVSPQHHSSTLKVEFSYTKIFDFKETRFLPIYTNESINIHEKLVLKQQ